MRFLLLLSALLSAVSGMVGSRAQAQPALSANVIVASIAGPSTVRVTRTVRRFEAGLSLVAAVVRFVPTPSIVAATVARKLFADRQRE